MTDFQISKVNEIHLIFLNELKGKQVRGNSPLTLYPIYRISFALDKTYAGNVVGLLVDVWTDTTVVNSVSTINYMGTSPLSDLETYVLSTDLLSNESTQCRPMDGGGCIRFVVLQDACPWKRTIDFAILKEK